jgi:hypothetical protein
MVQDLSDEIGYDVEGDLGCCGKFKQQTRKTTFKAEEDFKTRFQLVLAARDTAQLCEFVGGPGDPQALYDDDVGDDIIVRCHRKIIYLHGTIYSGFVDCGFDCMQKQHKCVKADDMQLIATGHSMSAIDVAFEREAGIRDHSALCRLLLQHGADPNARDAKGFSPLMWTVPDAKNAAGQIEQLRFASALMLQRIKEICSNCNCKRKICRLGANRFKSS